MQLSTDNIVRYNISIEKKRSDFNIEVASVFENTDIYGNIINVLRPSSGIHTFVLKRYMDIVPDGMTLQEYPPTVNTPSSNSNKFLLQIAINKTQTMGYTFSSHQLSRSSSTSVQKST